MREHLLHGFSFTGRLVDVDTIEVEERAQRQFLAEMRKLWTQHRTELMAEGTAPGRRPYGFYRFELEAEPRTAFEEIDILDKAGLVTGEEAIAIEKANEVLNAKQSPEFASKAHVGLRDRAMLRGLACEHRIAADWQARRGRAELQAKYEWLAGEVDVCIKALESQGLVKA